ncbi:hypothetical protein OEZ85_010151 [Tetradesmus obliquus]|uniref:Alpha-L-glutamate ligase-related protein ATP-grasp domain-containing protein n=1 Tax=Tetradesmus obliquus TaxID=3088 RepID=A0ABY8TNK4_TETOB|nr:hypothetical protein OEZ85_010151 [Tetradesmus obliquus]
MLKLLHLALELAYTTLVYYAAFLCYYVGQQPIGSCSILAGDTKAEVHLYSLAKQLLLWDTPHYRAATFADDLRANLKNVAMPGTGVPLSVFCYSRATALLFVLLVNPVACLAAACYLRLARLSPSSPGSSSSRPVGLADTYRQLLLAPQHWFAIWRHNCVLMGCHALATGSSSYSLEDKGAFLLQGQRLGLPVSPFYQAATVFVKHKSVEGGMGINVFKNFAAGGDWIIQPALANSAALAALLPRDAPLSTLRVVTASIAWLQEQAAQQAAAHSSSPLRQRQVQFSTDDSSQQQQSRPGSGASGSSSRGDGPPQLQVPGGTYRPGPATPPLPVSAGVMRHLNVDGRGVSSAKQHGMADPALPPSFGVWGQRHQQQQQAPCSQQPAAAVGQAVLGQQQEVGASLPADVSGNASAASSMQRPQQQAPAVEQACVEVVTAVWRAGLAGKCTDHSSICFGVDVATGALSPGVTANHWYRLGLAGAGRVDAAAARVWQSHPDTGKQVAGCVLPGMADVLDAAVAAHMAACPNLPLVGWDVALTPEGVFILEVNLSCNLFNGAFDSASYYSLLWHYFDQLGSALGAGRKKAD